MFKHAMLFTIFATIASYNCSAMIDSEIIDAQLLNDQEFSPNEEVIIETRDGGYDHRTIKGFCKKLHCTHAVDGVDSKPICEYVDQENYDCSELECFQNSLGEIACQSCRNRKVKRFYIVDVHEHNSEACVPEHLLHSTQY